MTRFSYCKDFKIWLYEDQGNKQIDYHVEGRVIFSTNDEEQLTENIKLDVEVYEITPYIFITEDYYIPIMSNSRDAYLDLQFRVYIQSEVFKYWYDKLTKRSIDINFDDERRYL